MNSRSLLTHIQRQTHIVMRLNEIEISQKIFIKCRLNGAIREMIFKSMHILTQLGALCSIGVCALAFQPHFKTEENLFVLTLVRSTPFHAACAPSKQSFTSHSLSLSLGLSPCPFFSHSIRCLLQPHIPKHFATNKLSAHVQNI